MRLRRRDGGKLFTTMALSTIAALAAVGFFATPAAAQGLLEWLSDDRPRAQVWREMGPREPIRPRARRASERHGWKTASYRYDDALIRKGESERSRHKLDPLEAPSRSKFPQSKADAEPGRKAEAVTPGLPLFLVVSIADQHVSVYNHEGLVARSAVSTGIEGHPTPRGIYTIIGRERYHASNIYSGAPMPYMQRVTWSGVAMHVGIVPGHPASHGCIRLPADFAARLWGMTKIGERVVIAPHETTPHEFAHPLLPTPKMRTEEASNKAPSASQGQPDVAAEPTRLNPSQYAQRLKLKAAADKAAAAKIIRESAAVAARKEFETVRLQRELDVAMDVQAAARARLDEATKAAKAASAAAVAKRKESLVAASGLRAPDAEADADARTIALGLVRIYEQALAARNAAAAAEIEAEAALWAAEAKVEAVRKASSANDAELIDAGKRSSEASAALEAATNAEREALRRLTPVSALVSKKDGRIYVRQGLAPLFDAPVKFRDPERPLGSHLFIASAASEDGAALKWTVLSWPARAGDEPKPLGKKLASAEELALEASLLAGDTNSPSEALDRIEMAPDVRDKIGELLWVGGSLIVSDQPPSSETGNVGTDLTVRLR